jgi:hemerythrin-like domain-containing protein
MNKLLEDHKTSREVINALDNANLRYIQGYHASVKEIHEGLLQLITLYPQHIKTENKQFFVPVMDSFHL